MYGVTPYTWTGLDSEDTLIVRPCGYNLLNTYLPPTHSQYMARSIWEVFCTLFRGGEETDKESSEADDEGRFVPSPLDLSVRLGHGGSESERAHELSKISERAQELEEKQPDK